MNSIAWVMAPPQETMTADVADALPKRHLAWSGILAFLSYAVAEAVMMPQRSSDDLPAMAQIIVSFIQLALLAILSMVELQAVTRCVRSETLSFSSLLTRAGIALSPLHLALPIALMCKPMGTAGVIFYAIGTWMLWITLLRRMVVGFQLAYSWPVWGAWLLVLSPLLMGAALFAILAAVLAAGAALALLGALA